MNRKIDQLFIKIQWFIILIAGIFLLLHGAHQNLVIIIWIFSILCNAFWARGSRIANVEYTYFRLFRCYPTIWLAIRMLLVVMMSLFVIGYTI